jgi:hypothetical protein
MKRQRELTVAPALSKERMWVTCYQHNCVEELEID